MKKVFPQSVRFNYVLTDKVLQGSAYRNYGVDDNLYLAVIQTIEIHGRHHGSGHRKYKNILSEAKCIGFSHAQVIVLKN